MVKYSGMKYWAFAGALVVFLSLGLMAFVAGCADDGGSSTVDVGNVPLPVDSITVSGEGQVKAGPDEAVLSIVVETEGAEASQALDENSKQMTQVLERLKAEGLTEESLQTANVAVYPNRRYDPQTGQETLVGYRAQNSIRVTLTDLTTVGDVFSAAAEAGANNISGPEWRLADDSAAVNEALSKAYASARAKAEALAEAAGVKVGDVLTMQESSVAIPPVMYEARLDMAATDAVAAVPINPMDLEVRGSVTVTYRLTK